MVSRSLKPISFFGNMPVIWKVLVVLIAVIIVISFLESIRYTTDSIIENDILTLDVARSSSEGKRVFFCGYPSLFTASAFNLAAMLFSDYSPPNQFHRDINTTNADIMVRTVNGPCDFRASVLPFFFPGKILSLNGEPQSETDIRYDGQQTFGVGPYADTNATLRVHFGAMVLAVLPWEMQMRIYSPQLRFKNSRKHFLLYASSNCVRFRDDAVVALSKIKPVHLCGLCGGRTSSGFDRTRFSWSPACRGSSKRWMETNTNLFEDYRFGLVMENTNQPGYIAEKIFNAFLSGTVPIWYGTPDIFDIFNREAFIYYDIDNPQPALEKVAYLERNSSAYSSMLNLPILANGKTTIEDYFSFRDDLGGGKLRKRIRKLMGV